MIQNLEKQIAEFHYLLWRTYLGKGKANSGDWWNEYRRDNKNSPVPPLYCHVDEEHNLEIVKRGLLLWINFVLGGLLESDRGKKFILFGAYPVLLRDANQCAQIGRRGDLDGTLSGSKEVDVSRQGFDWGVKLNSVLDSPLLIALFFWRDLTRIRGKAGRFCLTTYMTLNQIRTWYVLIK
jgi:hypothetical protein